MKRMFRFPRPATAVVAAALFCMALILVYPSAPQAQQTGAPAAQTQAAQTAAPAAQPQASETSRIDARIKAFHARLKITPAQEEQWNKLADVMRENATTMMALAKARRAKGAMNAVDDLKSYSEIVDAQAAGLHKFIPAFEPLYNSMSDGQKKNADAVFTRHFQKKAKKK